MTKVSLEDMSVGQQFRSKSVALSAEEIIRFARDNDPQFFHLDPEAAKDSMFGGLVASGWQTAALAIRLLLDAMGGEPVNGVVGADTQVCWRLPVRPGDQLHIEAAVREIRRPRSRPDRGFVSLDVKLVDQSGAIMLTQKLTMIMFNATRDA